MHTFSRWGSCHGLCAGRICTKLDYTPSLGLTSGVIKCRRSEWVKTDFQNSLVTDGVDHIFKGAETQFETEHFYKNSVF